ncbi:hypothetical protein [Delftia sp. Cs1-4]|uniref:hypothetical protein n=1 Tax=Delftia sp. (strain Cs1-4) TaxID=742013 RepID=UPI0005C15966|nr:hypothetical protein [Delftia sp. Cs1-4]
MKPGFRLTTAFTVSPRYGSCAPTTAAVDGLLAYALRFAGDGGRTASSGCWDLIAQARHCLREMEHPGGRGDGPPGTFADGVGTRAHALQALLGDGLTLGECIRAFAVSDDDPYVAAARTAVQADDDVEIDDWTATSVGEGGAWVLAWLWVSDAQAGVLSHSEMLEDVWRRAGDLLTGAHGLDDGTAWLRNNQVLWLEEVLGNFADEIDGIESARPASEPGAIVWRDERGHDLRFAPSEAVSQLLVLARRAGLRPPLAEHCQRFCAQYGGILDAMLAALRTG